MPILDTILAKAQAAQEGLEQQKGGGFIYVLFIDEDRETFRSSVTLRTFPKLEKTSRRCWTRELGRCA
jgi:hypothetical protein